MAEINTDSYPKPVAGKSIMDQIQQINTIEQQQKTIEQSEINIDKSKLELAIKNQDQLLQTLNALPKDASADEMRQWGQSAVKAKLVNPKIYAEFVTNMPPPTGDPTKDTIALQRYRQTVEQRAMNTAEMMKWKYGIDTQVEDGQSITPAKRDPRSGGITPSSLPIQRQLPPEAPTVGPEGPRALGPQNPVLPEGAKPVPGGFPGQYQPQPQGLAAVAQPPAQTGERPGGPVPSTNRVVGDAEAEARGIYEKPATLNERFGQYKPSGPATGQTPMFEEGKRMLVTDQQEASQRLMRVKPAQQALELMQRPGMLSGPISEGFTQGVAALKTFGLIPSEMNDPTAIRQEVAKKLADYVGKSPIAARSDASQALAEASSPNPKTQTLPALIKLTKDAIILDRVQAAMPNAFKDKDFSTYGKYKAAFPNTIDERAFGLDMEKDRGAPLVASMAKKLQSKELSERNQAKKFFKSLQMAEEQGFYQ